MTVRIIEGDVRDGLAQLPDQSIQCCVTSPPYYGRFRKGERRSPKTEFKPGEHWRERKPYWDRDWLYDAYVVKEQSTGDLAEQFGVTDAAILFWLRKHGIPRRTVSAARAVKHWALTGQSNGMHGKTGSANPRWDGGATPERQGFYASAEWRAVAKIVWKRDAGRCRRCNAKATDRGTFHIHHIVSFRVKEVRAEPTNLLLLCAACHRYVHSNANVNHELIETGRR